MLPKRDGGRGKKSGEQDFVLTKEHSQHEKEDDDLVLSNEFLTVVKHRVATETKSIKQFFFEEISKERHVILFGNLNCILLYNNF